jgi:ribose-phosphate pyrophosphokinase
VEKRRVGSEAPSITVIGDVRDKNVVVVDDEVDRGGTLSSAASILREAGARDVYACFVHATFSDGAAERLAAAGFKEIVCTNSQPIGPAKQLSNMTVIHLGRWLAAVIDAVHRGRSVGRTLVEYGMEC